MPSTKKLIGKKFANALIGDAAPKEGVLTAYVWTRDPGSIDIMTGKMAETSSGIPTLKGMSNIFAKQMGGLWVGGSLSLFEDSLLFEANAMNKALQTGSMSVEIPLAAITETASRFGFITGIIDVMWTKRLEAVPQFIQVLRFKSISGEDSECAKDLPNCSQPLSSETNWFQFCPTWVTNLLTKQTTVSLPL